ncbi:MULTISPECIES: hypothetical protein [unclassified Frankia]|uniref:hypothetical protein n=1 Tax=unclassified Frankia TaxID=2632575 RepID=UPI0020243221
MAGYTGCRVRFLTSSRASAGFGYKDDPYRGRPVAGTPCGRLCQRIAGGIYGIYGGGIVGGIGGGARMAGPDETGRPESGHRTCPSVYG